MSNSNDIHSAAQSKWKKSILILIFRYNIHIKSVVRFSKTCCVRAFVCVRNGQKFDTSRENIRQIFFERGKI